MEHLNWSLIIIHKYNIYTSPDGRCQHTVRADVTAVLAGRIWASGTLFWVYSSGENHADERVEDSPGKDVQPFSRREACMRVRE